MEHTKTIEIQNVIPLPPLPPLPCDDEEKEEWVYVEFPYKHLLPVLEAA